LQKLVEYYQEHSLNSVFPAVATTLKYAYYIIVSPPKRPIEPPWPISSKILPPDIDPRSLSAKAPVQLLNEVSIHTFVYSTYTICIEAVYKIC